MRPRPGPDRVRRRLLHAGAAGLGLAVAPRAASAQRAPLGHALLVGNTSYNPSDENLPPARKCVADLETRLQRFGFATVALYDAPVAQVQAELDRMQRAIAADPALAGVFYFVGHGFQSNAANFLVPAGGDLQAAPAALARTCVSLEGEVFGKLRRPAGPAATVIMVDACRTPDRPRAPTEGYNQTMPPDGCQVVFATGPGKRAFAPADPQRYTMFAEALLSELDVTDPGRSIFLTLETVKVKVAKQVNSIEGIVRAFGRNAQEPELASNVSGDPPWVPGARLAAAPMPPASSSAADAGATAELDAARAVAAPDEAIARLRALRQKLGEGDQADIADGRIADLEKVLAAARQARLNLDIGDLAARLGPRLAEDAQRALRGDKYAALRVAQALPPPAAGELIERSDRGRWSIFAAYLGNGIAAWQLAEHFRNVDRRDAEASRFLNLARANNYTPPRQLDQGR